jgi:Ca2+-binding RTX toxin-like protein
MNGSEDDEFFIAFRGSTGTDNNTIFGNGGDDWILGDSTDTWIPNASYSNGSIANAFNLEALTSTWTTSENATIGDYTIPHSTVLAEATIGQSEFYRVQIGAGQQITIDIDFASNTPIGTPRDLVVELQDSLGTIIATADDSLVTDGGLGSAPSSPNSGSSYDPYLTFSVTNAGIYYINVRPFGGGPGSTFTESNTFVMNVSVTGHAVAAANAIQGNDTIDGGEGDDSIFASGGADTVQGGLGNDRIDGGSGVDTINGGEGDDTLSGGDGTEETVHGDNGNDILISGGEGHYYGDAGNDTIRAGLTAGVNEYLDGGADIDTLDTRTWNGAYTIDLAAGTTDFGEIFLNFENLISGNGTDTVTGTAGNNDIKTNGGTDSINAGDGNDTIDGGAGDDTIDGGVGADTMAGGQDNDTFIVDNSGDVVVEENFPNSGVDTVMSSVSYTLPDNVEILTLTGAGNISGTGNALANTINGNGGNNKLDGKANADILAGKAGNDTYWVDAAGDVVSEAVGEGEDRIYTTVSYALGAGQEIEHLTVLDPNSGSNLDLTGNGFDNDLVGNAGNNVIDGQVGGDTMRGLLGNDTYVVDDDGDSVKENVGEGTDTVLSSITESLAKNVENLTLTGVGNINGTGNGLANTVVGNAGNNVLDGSGGADALQGGLGDDTYILDNSGDAVSEAAGEGTDTVKTGMTYVLGNNLENLILTGTGNYDGTGNGLDNTLQGNAGNNTLNGMGGADTMKGGLGNDDYVVDNIGDVIVEGGGDGNDRVQSSVTYTLGNNVEELTLTGALNRNGTGNGLVNILRGNTGNNILDGMGGADTMKGDLGDDTYVVDDAADLVQENGGEGTDTVLSSVTFTLAKNVENLTLTGTSNRNGTGNTLANTLEGNSGNNLLDGMGGADTMKGGAGNDTYVVDNASDVVQEGAGEGNDTVQAGVSHTLGNNVEKLLLTGTGNINGTGNSLDNTLTGNSGNNILDGMGGNDTLAGGTGNDTYIVDKAGDVITENAGEGTDSVQSSATYTLSANLENLLLTAAGNINGTGNDLANQITGNAGNNRIAGGLGNDVLSSGTGQDSYVFDTALSAATNVDTILDFDAPNDTIRLDQTIFTALSTGTLAGDAFRLGTGAVDATDRIIFDAASGDLFYDQDGIGGVAQIKFAHLDGSPGLTNLDFVVQS